MPVTVTVPQRRLKQRLTQIARGLGQIDAGMSQQAGKVDAVAERMDILVSTPGVGTLTAITMLFDMPELGKLDARQAAARAGLAPVPQRSGDWQGVARLPGGRPRIRRASYMLNLVALRYNPELNVNYTQFIAVGKRQKVALTAIMQKRRVMANPLLRAHWRWTEIRN